MATNRDELVSAETKDAILLRQCTDATGHFLQQDIPALMPHQVVDLLKAIQVYGVDGRERSVGGGLRSVIQPHVRCQLATIEGVAIGQLGEMIVGGNVVGPTFCITSAKHLVLHVEDTKQRVDDADAAGDVRHDQGNCNALPIVRAEIVNDLAHENHREAPQHDGGKAGIKELRTRAAVEKLTHTRTPPASEGISNC